jgi:hypothetical protein
LRIVPDGQANVQSLGQSFQMDICSVCSSSVRSVLIPSKYIKISWVGLWWMGGSWELWESRSCWTYRYALWWITVNYKFCSGCGTKDVIIHH